MTLEMMTNFLCQYIVVFPCQGHQRADIQEGPLCHSGQR